MKYRTEHPQPVGGLIFVHGLRYLVVASELQRDGSWLSELVRA